MKVLDTRAWHRAAFVPQDSASLKVTTRPMNAEWNCMSSESLPDPSKKRVDMECT